MQDHFMLLELLLPQVILGKAEKACSLCKNADPAATLDGSCGPSWS